MGAAVQRDDGPQRKFLFELTFSGSGTPLKAQPFADLLSDVFDPAIMRAAALTATAEASGGLNVAFSGATGRLWFTRGCP